MKKEKKNKIAEKNTFLKFMLIANINIKYT